MITIAKVKLMIETFLYASCKFQLNIFRLSN